MVKKDNVNESRINDILIRARDFRGDTTGSTIHKPQVIFPD